MSIKVLVADDSGVMRQAICRLLHAEPEIEVVGEAADHAQTILMTNDLKPQVIVLDLHMPDETKFTPMEFRSQLNHNPLLLGVSLWNDQITTELAKSFDAIMRLDNMELAQTLGPSIMQSLSPKPATDQHHRFSNQTHFTSKIA